MRLIDRRLSALLAGASLLTFFQLSIPDWYVVIWFVDGAILSVAIFDLFWLPSKRSFSINRETTRVASLKKLHRVTLTIINSSSMQRHVHLRDDVPQEFEATPPELTLSLPGRSRTIVHYDMTPGRRGAFVPFMVVFYMLGGLLVGPVVFGALADLTGSYTVGWLVVVGLLLLGSALTWWPTFLKSQGGPEPQRVSARAV